MGDRQYKGAMKAALPKRWVNVELAQLVHGSGMSTIFVVQFCYANRTQAPQRYS
jgi:hypothetical protein